MNYQASKYFNSVHFRKEQELLNRLLPCSVGQVCFLFNCFKEDIKICVNVLETLTIKMFNCIPHQSKLFVASLSLSDSIRYTFKIYERFSLVLYFSISYLLVFSHYPCLDLFRIDILVILHYKAQCIRLYSCLTDTWICCTKVTEQNVGFNCLIEQ